MKLPELTQEQLDALYERESAKRKTSEQKVDDDRKAAKELCSEAADTHGSLLYEIVMAMTTGKTKVYSGCKEAIDLKIKYFGGADQKSHTLTGENYKIQLGRNTIDGHDDTMESGIAKCEQYVESLIKNEASKAIISTLNTLLKGDKERKMDSGRIMELSKLANDYNDPLFSDGVRIIQQAYEKVMTSYSLKLSRKNEWGAWIVCAMSFSAAPFPEGFTTPLFKYQDEE